MAVNKVCPVVLRECDSVTQILVFVHPLAGKQLVKGTLEPEESIVEAASRELVEEAGIHAAPLRHLGDWQAAYGGQHWSFWLMDTAHMALPDEWQHQCADDGGHCFAFFWHPLAALPDEQWHPLFADALAYLRQRGKSGFI